MATNPDPLPPDFWDGLILALAVSGMFWIGLAWLVGGV